MRWRRPVPRWSPNGPLLRSGAVLVVGTNPLESTAVGPCRGYWADAVKGESARSLT